MGVLARGGGSAYNNLCSRGANCGGRARLRRLHGDKLAGTGPRCGGDATKEKLKKYFSGKLAVVQISGGVGAFALRSAGVYLAEGQPTWAMVLASVSGSFAGYLGVYALGYALAFRKDYKTSGRSMLRDMAQLQLVEQTPNILTVAISGGFQGILMQFSGMPPVIAANLGSWFGPQKIVNLAAMLAGNSLKKAWVDGTWKPAAVARGMLQRIGRLLKKVRGTRGPPASEQDAAAVALTRHD